MPGAHESPKRLWYPGCQNRLQKMQVSGHTVELHRNWLLWNGPELAVSTNTSGDANTKVV